MVRHGLPVLACVFAIACGPDAPPSDGTAGGSTSNANADGTSRGSDPGNSNTGSPSTTGPDTSSQDSSSATANTDDGQADSTGECQIICLADFPCNGTETRCIDPLTIEFWQDIPCEETPGCEDACYCQGGSCGPEAPEPCPANTLCLQSNGPIGPVASCEPIVDLCGGPDGLRCDEGQLCEYVAELCPECINDPDGCTAGSPVGRCVPQPASDFTCPELDENGQPFDPQCGCDGVTYLSECHRLQAGAALAGYGDCL